MVSRWCPGGGRSMSSSNGPRMAPGGGSSRVPLMSWWCPCGVMGWVVWGVGRVGQRSSLNRRHHAVVHPQTRPNLLDHPKGGRIGTPRFGVFCHLGTTSLRLSAGYPSKGTSTFQGGFVARAGVGDKKQHACSCHPQVGSQGMRPKVARSVSLRCAQLGFAGAVRPFSLSFAQVSVFVEARPASQRPVYSSRGHPCRGSSHGRPRHVHKSGPSLDCLGPRPPSSERWGQRAHEGRIHGFITACRRPRPSERSALADPRCNPRCRRSAPQAARHVRLEYGLRPSSLLCQSWRLTPACCIASFAVPVA